MRISSEKSSRFMVTLFWTIVGVSLLILAGIFGALLYQWGQVLFAGEGGISGWGRGFTKLLNASPLAGTIFVIFGASLLGLLIALCLGISVALAISGYLAENWAIRFLRFTTTFLSRLPCILIGIGAVFFFLRILHLEWSVWMGPVIAGLMMLPTVINLGEVFLRKSNGGYLHRIPGKGLENVPWKVLNRGIIDGLLLGILRVWVEVGILGFFIGPVLRLGPRSATGFSDFLHNLTVESINSQTILGKIIIFTIALSFLNILFNLLVRRAALKK
ncbi:MAG: hypothetical protein KAX20_02465 [Candidatus Omnitrophica bacterium]|nr:hypothetical protein [Candidatus Omnitrophota bacterium]